MYGMKHSEASKCSQITHNQEGFQQIETGNARKNCSSYQGSQSRIPLPTAPEHPGSDLVDEVMKNIVTTSYRMPCKVQSTIRSMYAV